MKSFLKIKTLMQFFPLNFASCLGQLFNRSPPGGCFHSLDFMPITGPYLQDLEFFYYFPYVSTSIITFHFTNFRPQLISLISFIPQSISFIYFIPQPIKFRFTIFDSNQITLLFNLITSKHSLPTAFLNAETEKYLQPCHPKMLIF